MANSAENKPNPLSYLPHEGREFEGHAPADAASPEIADKNADETIRKIMVAQKRQVSRRILPELERTFQDDGPAESEAEAVTEPEPAPVKPKATPRRAARSKMRRRFAQLRGLKKFRPSRGLSVLAVCALIMVWQPLVLPALLFGTFLVLLIAYLTLGPDRVTEFVAAAWDRLARRSPWLAESIRATADAAALRIDAVLDVLPKSWGDRISRPDFSSRAEKAAKLDNLPDPFDRLNKER